MYNIDKLDFRKPLKLLQKSSRVRSVFSTEMLVVRELHYSLIMIIVILAFSHSSWIRMYFPFSLSLYTSQILICPPQLFESFVLFLWYQHNTLLMEWYHSNQMDHFSFVSIFLYAPHLLTSIVWIMNCSLVSFYTTHPYLMSLLQKLAFVTTHGVSHTSFR